MTIDDYTVTGSEGCPVACSLHRPDGDGPWPLVAICHGFKGFKDWGFFPPLAASLAERGLAALRINFSHNGTGQGQEAAQFVRLDLFERDRMSFRLLDLAAALRGTLSRERRIDGRRLAVLGHSLGGAVALLSVRSLPFRALVTLACVGSTDLSPEYVDILEREGRVLIPNVRTGQMMPLGIAALRDLRAHRDEYDLAAAARLQRRPWLLIHGSEDTSVPPDASRRLQRLAPARHARLEIIDGADHVFGCCHPFAGPTGAYARVLALVTGFLEEALLRTHGA